MSIQRMILEEKHTPSIQKLKPLHEILGYTVCFHPDLQDMQPFSVQVRGSMELQAGGALPLRSFASHEEAERLMESLSHQYSESHIEWDGYNFWYTLYLYRRDTALRLEAEGLLRNFNLDLWFPEIETE